jgi:predicted dithiol-disulfide oxidoreductase (DUF899 family)
MEFSADHAFDGPDGAVTLLDLFQGRRRLIVYHFWLAPDGAVRRLLVVADQVGHLTHFNTRDTSFAFVSRATAADRARQAPHGLVDAA